MMLRNVNAFTLLTAAINIQSNRVKHGDRWAGILSTHCRGLKWSTDAWHIFGYVWLRAPWVCVLQPCASPDTLGLGQSTQWARGSVCWVAGVLYVKAGAWRSFFSL